MKYQRITPSGGKNIGIRKSEFVTKTQFFYPKASNIKPEGITLIMDLKRESKPEKSSNVLHTLNTQSIISFIRS